MRNLQEPHGRSQRGASTGRQRSLLRISGLPRMHSLCECREMALPRKLLKSFSPIAFFTTTTSGAKGPPVDLLPIMVTACLRGAPAGRCIQPPDSVRTRAAWPDASTHVSHAVRRGMANDTTSVCAGDALQMVRSLGECAPGGNSTARQLAKPTLPGACVRVKAPCPLLTTAGADFRVGASQLGARLPRVFPGGQIHLA